MDWAAFSQATHNDVFLKWLFDHSAFLGVAFGVIFAVGRIATKLTKGTDDDKAWNEIESQIKNLLPVDVFSKVKAIKRKA